MTLADARTPEAFPVVALGPCACSCVSILFAGAPWAVLIVKATFAIAPEHRAWRVEPEPCAGALIDPTGLIPGVRGASVVLRGAGPLPADRRLPPPRFAVFRGGAIVFDKRLPLGTPIEAFGPVGVPASPEDGVDASTDWEQFHVAPRDQRIDGVRGDEWIVFEGVHQELPQVRAQLPGFGAEVRVAGLNGARRLGPLALVADTLIVDARRMRIWIVWRGRLALRLGSSELGAYAGLQVPGVAIPWPSPPHPDAVPREIAASTGAGASADALDDPLGGPTAEVDTHLIGAALPFLPTSDAVHLPAAERNERDDFGDTAEVAVDLFHQTLPFAREHWPAARAALVASAIAPAIVQPEAPALAKRSVDARVPATTPEPPVIAPIAPAPPEPIVPPVAASPAAVAQPSLAGAAPDLRAEVTARLRAGQSCEGLDLVGADLSGMNLAEAGLDGMDLTGAKLTAANLSGARLVAAKLARADLRSADLSRADLSAADLSDGTLEDTKLHGTRFAQAKGARARFARAAGDHAVFARADWESSDFSAAVLKSADFTAATLRGARSDGANLEGAFLADVIGENASFQGATLTGTRAAGAGLAGACFRLVDAVGSAWEAAAVDGASFEGARLERASFVRATGSRVCFRDAILSGASFQRADLPNAELTRANSRASTCAVRGGAPRASTAPTSATRTSRARRSSPRSSARPTSPAPSSTRRAWRAPTSAARASLAPTSATRTWNAPISATRTSAPPGFRGRGSPARWDWRPARNSTASISSTRRWLSRASRAHGSAVLDGWVYCLGQTRRLAGQHQDVHFPLRGVPRDPGKKELPEANLDAWVGDGPLAPRTTPRHFQ